MQFSNPCACAAQKNEQNKQTNTCTHSIRIWLFATSIFYCIHFWYDYDNAMTQTSAHTEIVMEHCCFYAIRFSPPPELELHRYGLNADETYNFHGILNNDVANGTVRQAQDFLNRTYCGNVSIEFAYIESEHEREWLVENYEKLVSHANGAAATATNVSIDAKRSILELLLKSQTWDNFLATKFPTVKRYGGKKAKIHIIIRFASLAHFILPPLLYWMYLKNNVKKMEF